MPIIQPGGKVLVTGANGYIASWVVNTLLEAGYAVRGTVRSAAKGKHLVETFSKYGDKFEIVVVEDITQEGAFDEAVKGVDAIEHTASPFYLDVDDPQELIAPALKGTVGVLQSALKNGSSVKRIVVTASGASVLHLSPTPQVFSELNWNDQAIEIVKEQGRNAPNVAKYRASKTLAEKAAWEFVEKNKGSISWDLTVLNPPFVFGPIIHEVSTPSALNTSSYDLYKTVLIEGSRTPEALATQGSCWVDIRDIADAHKLALEKEAAGGERIIVAAGPYVWQDWIDVANSLVPSPIPSRTLVRGVPGAGVNAVHMIQYDTAKQARILGIKYRSKEETARDALADFARRGW